MERQIRRVGIVLIVAFLAVFLQLNRIQVFAAREIASNQANIRALLREYSIKRGDILTRDGVKIATSKDKGKDARLRYRRVYPGGELYGQITGFYSLTYGKTRVEDAYNEVLLGDAGVLTMQDIEDRLFASGEQGEDIVLTINSELQQAARDALETAGRGSVVAIEPATGHIKAMWSSPSFDPGRLATHNSRKAKQAWESLDPQSPRGPMVAASTSQIYPPGSTFKIVTAAAALESGRWKADSTFPDPDEIDLPQTDNTLTNFTNQSCTGTPEIDLFTAVQVSCDTTFALIGMRIPDEVREMAEAFGFNQDLPLDIGTAESVVPEYGNDEKPLQAYAGIGQADVAASPLQMAMVAAGVANEGAVMQPLLVHQILDPGGSEVRTFDPEVMAEAMSPGAARTLTKMMVAVVDEGTGTNAQIPGISVAGKTGTAQNAEGGAPHAWFIAFAPAENPEIAVAVIVESGGSIGAEATGGLIAAPIAKQVIEADQRISGW